MSLYENSIRIKGFLGKDAMTKSITNNTVFVAFSVATKSSYKDKQTGEWVSQTFWHRITAFGKPAIAANNLSELQERRLCRDYRRVAQLWSTHRSQAKPSLSAAGPGRFAPTRSPSFLRPAKHLAKKVLTLSLLEDTEEVPA